MKIKTPIDFLTFNDGVVSLYNTDDNEQIISNTRRDFRFGNQKIGITRFYAARHNDIELNRLIHIHKNDTVTTEDAAVIGSTRYKIEQIQQDFYSNPPSTILSLSQVGEWLDRVTVSEP